MLSSGIRHSVFNALLAVGANSIASIIRLIYVVALARGLGPEDYGTISSLQAFYLMFVFAATAGLAAFLSREFASNSGRARQAPSLTLWIEVALLLAFAILFWLFARFETNATIVVFFALTIPARGLAAWVRLVFLSREEGRIPLRLVAVFRSAELIAVLLALAFDADILSIVKIHFISWLAEAAVGILVVMRTKLLVGFQSAVAAVPANLPALAAISLVFASSEWLRAAPIIIFKFIGEDPAELGRFAFSWNAALMLYVPIVVALTAAFPLVSRAHERKDGKDLGFLDFVVRAGGILGALCTILAISFGSLAINTLVGAEYSGADPIFATAIACVGPIAINHALEQRLFLDEKTKLVLGLNLLALAALVASFPFALRTTGTLAAALCFFAILIALTISKLMVVSRHHPLGLGLAAIKSFCVGISCALATLAALPLGALGASIIGFLTLVFSVAILSVFSRDELKNFRSFMIRVFQ